MKPSQIIFFVAVFFAQPAVLHAGDISIKAQLVELHFPICDTKLSDVLSAFDIPEDSYKNRKIFFFDEKDFALMQNGTILKAYLTHKGKAKSVVKLRPIEYDRIDAKWEEYDGFSCEDDWYLEDLQSSCSIKEEIAASRLAAVANGQMTAKELFSEDQSVFAEEYSSRKIPWDEMISFGPIAAKIWEKNDLDIELWYKPNVWETIEISLRVLKPDAEAKRTRMLQYFKDNGLKTCTARQGKTAQLFKHLQSSPAR